MLKYLGFKADVIGFADAVRRRLSWAVLSIVSGALLTVADMVSVSLVVPLLVVDVNPMARVPLLGSLVDHLLAQSRDSLVVGIAVLLMIAVLARGIISILNRICLEIQRAYIETDLREQVLNQVLAVEPHFLEHERVGNLSTVLVSHASVAGAIADRLATTVVAGLQFLILAVVMMAISGSLTAIAFAMLGVAFFLTRFLSNKRLGMLAQQTNEAVVSVNQSLIEIVTNIRSIHLQGVGATLRRQAMGHVVRYSKVQKRRLFIMSLASPLFTTAIGLIVAGLLIVATFLTPNTSSATPYVLVLLMVMTRLAAPAATISETASYLSGNWYQVHELMNFIDRSNKPYLVDGVEEAPVPHDEIRFENVSFSYQSREVGLQEVSLSIPVGKIVAFTGPSGSGKSTLISLLARLCDPASGKITSDGQDIRDFRVDHWRSHLAVVAQDSVMLNGSLAENLRIVKAEATDDELWRVLEMAGAADFVRELPRGVDTLLGDRGANLSGGQRQRLAIARALLTDRKILVLDEATSQLDSDSEQIINGVIERLRGTYTVIIVAHRLATIRSADVIYLLSDGRVVDQGSHSELFSSSMVYRRVVELQAGEDNPHKKRA